LLLEAGLSPNTTFVADQTALMVAVERSHRNLVEMLIQKGADLDVANLEGETALIVALRSGESDLALLLLEKGANPNGAVGDGNLTALLLATDFPDVVAALLAKGADVTQTDTYRGRSALIRHVQAADLRGAKLLLSYGADPNSADIDGYTALMDAAGGNQAGIVDALLENRADVNAKDKDRRTALMVAAQFGSERTVATLLSHGADAQAVDNEGNTALTLAKKRGDLRMIHRLQQKTANKR
jgi:ankyrin repeat protein